MCKWCIRGKNINVDINLLGNVLGVEWIRRYWFVKWMFFYFNI